MEANKIGCRMCGGTSFTKTDKIAKCDYCGSEFDLTELQARAAHIETEAKTLDSLADNISRLRQLADQKEAERQKVIEEEKRRREKAEKQKQEELRKQQEIDRLRQKNLLEKRLQQQEVQQEASQKSCGCLVLMSMILLYSAFNFENHIGLFVFSLAATVILPIIIYLILMPESEK